MADQWLALAHQRNLVLVGGTGTGKTHLAVGIARACKLSIRADGHGEIAFGAMQASLDVDYAPSMVFFTWFGFDEMDEVTGTGSAELLDDGSLEIEFAYHLGDDAVLKAVRETSSTAC